MLYKDTHMSNLIKNPNQNANLMHTTKTEM